jgi:cytochrome c oxidase subunit IV
MMEHQNVSSSPKRGSAHTSVKGHVVSFIISIVLTALAFIAVIYQPDLTGFVFPYIIGLAVVQAGVQLFVWMHLSEKGHLFPIIGMMFGAVVMITCVVMALYWLW